MTFPNNIRGNLSPTPDSQRHNTDAVDNEPLWMQAMADAYQRDEHISQSTEVTRLQHLIAQRLQDLPAE